MATDYISREDAISCVKHAWAKGLEPTQYLEELEAADVVERKRGRWKGAGFGDYYCSWCNSTYCIGAERLDLYKFCPCCGADMSEAQK